VKLYHRHPCGEPLLTMQIPLAAIREWEVFEEGDGREFIVPAALVNEYRPAFVTENVDLNTRAREIDPYRYVEPDAVELLRDIRDNRWMVGREQVDGIVSLLALVEGGVFASTEASRLDKQQTNRRGAQPAFGVLDGGPW
jgi:hypothetical protein